MSASGLAAIGAPGTAAGRDLARTAQVTALLLLALAVPSLVALVFDERTILGANVWSKPLKFQLSFALHAFTLAWVLRNVDDEARRSVGLHRWVLAGAIAALVEVAYITLQGARGRASHFNFETWLDSVLYYGLMGGAAVVMMVSTLAVGLYLGRYPSRGIGPGFGLGARLGLVVGSIATLLVTAPLAAGAIDGPGPWVGGIRSHASGLPITGWSTTGGDLRVPHFVAVHIIQLLPLTGALADRWLPERARAPAVVVMLTLALGALVATFRQAARGEPLLAL